MGSHERQQAIIIVRLRCVRIALLPVEVGCFQSWVRKAQPKEGAKGDRSFQCVAGIQKQTGRRHWVCDHTDWYHLPLSKHSLLPTPHLIPWTFSPSFWLEMWSTSVYLLFEGVVLIFFVIPAHFLIGVRLVDEFRAHFVPNVSHTVQMTLNFAVTCELFCRAELKQTVELCTLLIKKATPLQTY